MTRKGRTGSSTGTSFSGTAPWSTRGSGRTSPTRRNWFRCYTGISGRGKPPGKRSAWDLHERNNHERGNGRKKGGRGEGTGIGDGDAAGGAGRSVEGVLPKLPRDAGHRGRARAGRIFPRRRHEPLSDEFEPYCRPPRFRSIRTSLMAAFSVSKTPIPVLADASNSGTLRRLRSAWSSASEATFGRSRLLYWITMGSLPGSYPCSRRFSRRFSIDSSFASTRVS